MTLAILAISVGLQVSMYEWVLELTAFGISKELNYALAGTADLLGNITLYFVIDRLDMVLAMREFLLSSIGLFLAVMLTEQRSMLAAVELALINYVGTMLMGLLGVILPLLYEKEVRGTMNNLVMGIGILGGASGPLLPGSSSLHCSLVFALSLAATYYL
jgi:hypothetical protein